VEKKDGAGAGHEIVSGRELPDPLSRKGGRGRREEVKLSRGGRGDGKGGGQRTRSKRKGEEKRKRRTQSKLVVRQVLVEGVRIPKFSSWDGYSGRKRGWTVRFPNRENDHWAEGGRR